MQKQKSEFQIFVFKSVYFWSANAVRVDTATACINRKRPLRHRVLPHHQRPADHPRRMITLKTQRHPFIIRFSHYTSTLLCLTNPTCHLLSSYCPSTDLVCQRPRRSLLSRTRYPYLTWSRTSAVASALPTAPSTRAVLWLGYAKRNSSPARRCCY